MKRILIFSIAIFIIFAQTLYSQELSNFSNADISIKLYNKTMYYPDNTADNPILVHITIANKGSETLRFKLADDRMFSINFSAFNTKNVKLKETEELIRKRTTNQTVYFREISIESGEEYSFIENLKDYLVITSPSVYYFELDFYPELYKSKMIALTSNRLSIDIKPSPSAATTKLPTESTTYSILKPEEIAPDKVVEQTIIARQKSLWDQFFLYMDVEEMLKSDSERQRRYTTLSDSDRIKMIETYKENLMQSRIDTDIVAIPESFSIEQTSYSQTEGIVTVIEWFKYDRFKEKKRYTYYVRQRDGIWNIYKYDIENLGTE